jgi:MFS family permease
MPRTDIAGDIGSVVETDIPARLDRLPWGRFHTLVVAALGITWILDGLEVTVAGSVAGALKGEATLHLSNAELGAAGSAYLLGAVLGGVFFGWLTDRLGRRKLFFITLFIYISATAATALSWDWMSFAIFRFLTGAGIGGEYTAINSTIQELVPARMRGWTDLVINGSFWVGAALGAAMSIPLLDPSFLDPDMGWRLCFLTGAVLGLFILVMRFWIPESPRWLMTQGRIAEAGAIVAGIEGQFRRLVQIPGAAPPLSIRLKRRGPVRFREIALVLFGIHRRSALIGLALMTAQAFFYNAIFFTYALVLTEFYSVPAAEVGWYILPFALGNFLGPLFLGRLFDVVGRRPMIAFTYATSGVLLILSGYLFEQNLLTGTTQTIAWTVVFFFASAAASSAYLTVSETFPLEMRALAIAIFYALGTGLGGVVAPLVFSSLIETGSRDAVFTGYLFGAVLMIAAAIVQAAWGVAAERKSLEAVARPLSSLD